MSAESERERDGTRAEIMEATYRALCAHGYADLTMQRIADEFSKSKSLLYYHYDSKDALLVDFLDYLIDRFVENMAVTEESDPDEELRCLLDGMLPAEPDEEKNRLRVAMLELRAQAPYDEAFREQFRKNDRVFHETVAEYIRAGVEQGVYREVDPDATAEYLHATVNGAILRGATLGEHDATPTVRDALDGYLDSLRRDE